MSEKTPLEELESKIENYGSNELTLPRSRHALVKLEY